MPSETPDLTAWARKLWPCTHPSCSRGREVDAWECGQCFDTRGSSRASLDTLAQFADAVRAPLEERVKELEKQLETESHVSNAYFDELATLRQLLGTDDVVGAVRGMKERVRELEGAANEALGFLLTANIRQPCPCCGGVDEHIKSDYAGDWFACAALQQQLTRLLDGDAIATPDPSPTSGETADAPVTAEEAADLLSLVMLSPPTPADLAEWPHKDVVAAADWAAAEHSAASDNDVQRLQMPPRLLALRERSASPRRFGEKADAEITDDHNRTLAALKEAAESCGLHVRHVGANHDGHAVAEVIVPGAEEFEVTVRWSDRHRASVWLGALRHLTPPDRAPTSGETEERCDHPWHGNPGLITPCPQCDEGAEKP